MRELRMEDGIIDSDFRFGKALWKIVCEAEDSGLVEGVFRWALEVKPTVEEPEDWEAFVDWEGNGDEPEVIGNVDGNAGGGGEGEVVDGDEAVGAERVFFIYGWRRYERRYDA